MDCTIGLLVAKSGPDVSGSKNIARPVAVVHHLEPPGGFRRFRMPTQPSPWSRKGHKEFVLVGDSKRLASCVSGHAIWAHPRRAHTSIQEFFLGRPRQHPAHAPGRGRAAGDRYGDGERRWRHLADDQGAGDVLNLLAAIGKLTGPSAPPHPERVIRWGSAAPGSGTDRGPGVDCLRRMPFLGSAGDGWGAADGAA